MFHISWDRIGLKFLDCSIETHTQGGGRSCHSDRYENSFIMVVYEKSFFSRALDRKFWLIDNHYKTIFVSIRMACSSPTVIQGQAQNFSRERNYINDWSSSNFTISRISLLITEKEQIIMICVMKPRESVCNNVCFVNSFIEGHFQIAPSLFVIPAVSTQDLSEV